MRLFLSRVFTPDLSDQLLGLLRDAIRTIAIVLFALVVGRILEWLVEVL